MRSPFDLDGNDVVALPVDDLALRVLKDARDNSEWNWRNWLLSVNSGYDARADALLALGSLGMAEQPGPHRRERQPDRD